MTYLAHNFLIFGQFALLYCTVQASHTDTPPPQATPPSSDRWRLTHMGRLMGHALRRFDARVLALMAASPITPLALSHLAARQQVGAAHIHITRHLPLEGARLTDLAASAGMTKQAMGTLVDQCEAWGLVLRFADGVDARAKRVAFTPLGLDWLRAFRDAVEQAEQEFREEVGDAVATVVSLGLEAYANGEHLTTRPRERTNRRSPTHSKHSRRA